MHRSCEQLVRVSSSSFYYWGFEERQKTVPLLGAVSTQAETYSDKCVFNKKVP